ncbi:MAG: FAD binding domain-containing protein [Chloroflexia bacterium]|nr:FAD binding domain-containing protein [Chloroflexia bacterium]
MWEDYIFAESIDNALEALEQYAGRARIIGGGTDLALQAQQGKCVSEVMVDLSRIPGLDRLEEREGWLWIGPQVTHAQVAASPLVREKAGLLAEACGRVGGPQIRHVGTLVGNVVNAMPAADGAVALFALDAQIEVTDRLGSRWVPIEELYAGVGVCRMNACYQVVSGIRFRPLPPCSGWAFLRLGQRRANILPMLNTALVACLEDGRFSRVRIAVGPVAPTPFRAHQAEELLQGQPASQDLLAQAAQLARQAAHPRNSAVRGSREYRQAMVEVLVRRGLEQALAMARA